MKVTVHIKIGDYEFVEFEGEDLTKEKVRSLIQDFHDLGVQPVPAPKKETWQAKKEKINSEFRPEEFVDIEQHD